jgi:Histidine kinase-, DNA gyrase B-, and HSP90-like ATPase
MAAEQVRLEIGNLDNAVLVTGQAYQDPKDALNEFVSNAADEYALAGRRGERIGIALRRKGRYPVLAVDDVGRGMSLDDLRRLARSLFDSSKLGDDRTLGEKAIGLLAFQQLGGRCEIVTRPEGETRTHALRLERGHATASLEPDERRRARQVTGTTVYVSDLDPDVLRVLTPRKVVDYLRRRRGPALARGDYTIEVVEGKRNELVTPEQPEGVRLAIPAQNTLWGRIEFALYVAPEPEGHRRVAVVGRAGTTIIDDVCGLEELDAPPWSTDQVSGQIGFAALQQTSGRRAIVRDRDAFPVFVDAVRSVEPIVTRTLEQVAREVDVQVADRLSDTVRRVFGRVLREIADVDERRPFGPEPTGMLIAVPGSGSRVDDAEPPCDDDAPTAQSPPPRLEDITTPDLRIDSIAAHPSMRSTRVRTSALPTVAPDPHPAGGRSRFDHDAGIVFYNERHPDYLLVKDDEAVLLDYLATLVAKEYVVWNNPRAPGDELAEEMVRLVVRVRRHLPRRLNPKPGPRPARS